ncbi:MAG TPA: ATP-binding protein [Phaeodactylibacter sp.]|nr:ATP-binding protein [Phaeodactylibacter sp.]
MDKKEAYKRIIADFFTRDLSHVLPRKYDIPLALPKVISLTGPRRAGKTFLLFELIKQLREEGSPKERLVYVNFEDDRLFPIQLSDLDVLLQAYYEMYPDNKEKKVWFFFDEIQEVRHWEKFIRRVHDQENCQLFVTGSSSKLLSREIASSLRGRTLSYEILPLSFREFLDFNSISPDVNTSKGQALLNHWLTRYMQQGGFPELIFLPQEIHQPTIQEYLDLVLYRDITERFNIKNPALLKYLLKYLLNNISNRLSYTKTYNDLRSRGFSVSKNTVLEYISYLEEAFVLFQVSVWNRSLRAQAINPRKVYAIDPAFRHAMSVSADKGRVMENLVFLELKRRGKQPFYYSNGREVDFFLEDEYLINVALSIDEPNTFQRETESLFSAMKQLNISESSLITLYEKRTLRREGKTIHIQPLADFLLNTSPASKS